MREVRLPSGAILKLHMAPFADAKALYQALLEEAKGLKLDPQADVDANFYKDIFCAGFSSKKIEDAIWKCMAKSLYNDNRITEETFEPATARDDYMTVLFEVTVENVGPFTKSLSASFARITAMIQNVPA